MKRIILINTLALVACLFCSMKANAYVVQPYAAYTGADSTLTFYYDDQWTERTVFPLFLSEDLDYPDWYTYGYYRHVARVVFDPSFADARPTTTRKWFMSMYNLRTIEGIEYLNTSEVTNMYGMF